MKTLPTQPRSYVPAPKTNFRHRVLPRLIFAIPLVFGSALLWWSIREIRPVIGQSEALTARVTKLTIQVEELERREQALSRQNVLDRYSTSISRHFTGQEDVAAWLDELREKAMVLALDLTPRFSEAENLSVGTENLVQIPVSLDVKPAAGIESQRSVYQRTMEFTHYVASHPKRAEMQRFAVSGRNGSISRVQFNLNLWGIAPKP